jgi:hypothetical protein
LSLLLENSCEGVCMMIGESVDSLYIQVSVSDIETKASDLYPYLLFFDIESACP